MSLRYPIESPFAFPAVGAHSFEIPCPFCSSDKERIKKQIDLLLTEEDEAAVSSAATRSSVD